MRAFAARPEVAVGGAQARVATFARVEFQDGSRQEGANRYDGPERPRLHVLFFAHDLQGVAAGRRRFS
eukprot:14349715-Alexandrium_andersonii.AAC.1